MNDWLDYQGSGSSRAYIAHYGVKGMKWDPSKLFGKPQETDKQKVEQIKANDKLVSALYEQYNKYESELGEANMNYKELDNILIPKQQQKISDAKDMLKELETKYSNLSKSNPLEATQRYSRNIWAQKKNIQELESGLERLKKTQMDYKRKMEIASVKADDIHKKITEVEGDSSAISRSRRIKQSYFDMPTDEFIEHAFLGIESKKEREARLKDQKEKQSKAESALIDSQFDLARKYQTEYNQNKDKLTKAKKSADDLYSRYSETAAQLTKLEKQQREMSSSGVSQEVLRRNVPIIPQLRNKKEVLNNKYQEAYAKYIELRDRQKWLDDKLKSIVKYFDADGRIDSYGK